MAGRSSSGGTGGHRGGILADLLHEISHKVGRQGTWLAGHLLTSCCWVCTWSVRVHLHHDHRDCLVADPDDPGAGLSLSSLLIGRGSLWGEGLSLTWLLWLASRLGGWGLSLSAIGRNSH